MSRKYLQTSFSFDYGNRRPIETMLLQVCEKYKDISTEIGFIFCVNNIPYKLEFYFVLEVESNYEKEFKEIKHSLNEYAIKELTFNTTRSLMNQMKNRRFNILTTPCTKEGIEMAFHSEKIFLIDERTKLKDRGFEFFNTNLYTDTVFFSYSNKDLIDVFDKTINMLNADAYPVFLDRKSLYVGNQLNSSLDGAIKDAKSIIFFIDKEFKTSEYCLKELELAKKYNKNMLMIVNNDTEIDSEYLFKKLDFNTLTSDQLYKIIREYLIGK
ncbi:toll/interleukin-1 receptor domain-containing protein [Sulfurovum sp. NBC37-1]|uniref:toll/interleukin-1 receptor domain-containing protein n=1 Tax=Sulfurovum sp. (strain NBC37-1) TaxID=387093 RepID=UPI0001587B43|nr:toll/interleukin-1 receptor domain-containing protein [Sulfurovum sp. NBC37-1]BAF73055.1 hypothetical protein SUN_2115 [Sulfurovum sp. NBC37-1]